ncbi:hypothetical protein J6N69_00390 [bacterium]|nr:hypothetical protein [bacterium]
MDKTSLETINKGKRNFITLTIGIFLLIGIIIGLFTNYKEETLVCDKAKDNCYVEKTNMLNSKKREDIIAISNIANVLYTPKTVAGNMYAKGYTAYYLSFYSKQKESIKIFSTEYYEKEQVKEVANNLRQQLKDPKAKIIKITQKL